MAGLRDKIKHIVVLMLENRSFDSMLGQLYPNNPDFDGLTLAESNPGGGGPVPVWNDPTLIPGSMTIPTPDPGELFTDITQQIFGAGPSNPADMQGFARNYEAQTATPPYDGRSVMHYYTPDQLPVMSTLAKQYAVCDRWHASAPNQTWPNRFFAHCATAGGYVNNSPAHFPYMMHSIFERIGASAIPNGWKVYFHDIPQALTLARLWSHQDRFCWFNEFLDDAKKGALPAYSFIEPRYFADLALGMPNDQHPPHDVVFREQLVAQVYNAIRQSPSWPETLLVITYDEHGGCFDHVVPPPALTPGDHAPSDAFAFDRYGVRVPAIIVSPYIAPGTILRPAGKYPFDHTSIIATVRKCFNLGGPLTVRDAAAPDLDSVLTLNAPSNTTLGTVTPHPYQPTTQDLQDAMGKPLTDVQEALHRLATLLPAPGTDVESHIANLAAVPAPVATPPSVGAAVAGALQRIKAIL